MENITDGGVGVTNLARESLWFNPHRTTGCERGWGNRAQERGEVPKIIPLRILGVT